MLRGLQITLAIGLTGVILALFSSPVMEPRTGWQGEGALSRPAQPTSVAPNATAEDKVGGQAAQAQRSRPGLDLTNLGEALPEKVRPGSGQLPRLPAQIAQVVKRHNLEMVIEKYAQQYGVDEDLVWAVIRQESGFNPAAVSPKGAMGLMQLMPGTAALMGVSDAFDVEQNIAGGIKYLERCLSRFNQDVGLGLAAYNAGPENVVKYQGCPPFPETRHYVASILQAYAGESMRADLKLIGLSPVEDEDVADAARPRGLPWRVALAKWRIATPHCQLGPPRWKVALRPF
jgi:soluble lytic murein transglycosylase-like protein